MRGALVIALAAACTAHHAASRGGDGPHPLPDARPLGSPEPHYDPPPSGAPDRVLAAPVEAACAPAARGVTGEPPPDPDRIARLTAHPWCQGDGANGWVGQVFRADGTFSSFRGLVPSEVPSGCWATSGETLWLRAEGAPWSGWTLRTLGPDQLAWAGRLAAVCPPPPPPPDPRPHS